MGNKGELRMTKILINVGCFPINAIPYNKHLVPGKSFKKIPNKDCTKYLILGVSVKNKSEIFFVELTKVRNFRTIYSFTVFRKGTLPSVLAKFLPNLKY